MEWPYLIFVLAPLIPLILFTNNPIMEIIDNMDENNMLKQQMTDQQMTDEERYHITNEVARTKLEDAGGSVGDEIWTLSLIHI